MGTKLASEVVTRAGDLIQDATNVRWPVAELLRWLSDGQREVVNMRPDAYNVVGAIALTTGNTRQNLPSGGLYLIDVVRNSVGTKGPIRLVGREVLDAQVPTWHSDAPSQNIKHFVYDPRVPTSFFLYPAPAAGSAIEAVYSIIPPDMISPTQAISVPDTFFNALIDYVCFRSYSKDAEYAGNAARAQAHYQSFTASIGANNQSIVAYSPEASAPGNPNVPKK